MRTNGTETAQMAQTAHSPRARAHEATEATGHAKPAVCEWPAGCNHAPHPAALKPAAGIGLWLCLRHLRAHWTAYRNANRLAGLCRCGADPTPGHKTCPRCREADRRRKQRWRLAQRGLAMGTITVHARPLLQGVHGAPQTETLQRCAGESVRKFNSRVRRAYARHQRDETRFVVRGLRHIGWRA